VPDSNGRYACPYCEKDYANPGARSNHVRAHHAEETRDEVVEPDEVTQPEQQSAEDAPAPPAPEEQVPRKPGLMQRIRSRRGRSQGGGLVPASAERAPRNEKRRRVGRRLPLDADISDIWAFGGRRLERTPHYPTGRMLEYQAPAAGVIIDRAVAGTLPDRVIFQPLARNRDKYEDVGFLLAGPLLTFSITTTMGQMQKAADEGNQELFSELSGKLGMQREMFSWVLSKMLPRLAAGAKMAAEKKAKRDAAIADAFPELGDDDPVEVLVTMLFQPPRYEEATQNGKADRATADPGEQGAVQFGE
jgi:hypothetical protein